MAVGLWGMRRLHGAEEVQEHQIEKFHVRCMRHIYGVDVIMRVPADIMIMSHDSYISDMALGHIHGAYMEGPQLRCGRRVPDLAYADDFVLMAGTSAGLQRLLDAAVEFCQLVGMVISVQKSKVLVFIDIFPGPYEWLCGGSPLQWVAHFEYLGVTLSAESGMGPTFGKLHKNMWAAWALLQRQYGKLHCSASVWLLLRVYDVCVPPTASYGCEVWALRTFAIDARKARESLASSHLKMLRQIAGVRTAVATPILFRELDRCPLSHAWWQRVVKFWNNLVQMPAPSLHKQVALDDCHDAVVGNVKNWAWSVMRGLRDLGYHFTIRCDALELIDVRRVMDLLHQKCLQDWHDLDVCPRTCPSKRAHLCTYDRWFARPARLRSPSLLLQQPLSASCMRTLLRFRMGCHGLPNDLGRRAGTPRRQRSCPRCAMPGVADERHLVFECPAMQPVRDQFPHLFGDDSMTMQAFMWQDDLPGVARFIHACFASFTDSAGGCGSSNQP